MKDTSVIPPGLYCYKIVSVEDFQINTEHCPYWSRREDKDEQESGYCSFLEVGDWEDGWGLLWDGVKACSINMEDEEDAIY
jgi:hypothetical protein